MTLPPKCPVARAAEPLCVAPKRAIPVDDGTDAIGAYARQIAEFPDTIEHTPTTQVRRKL